MSFSFTITSSIIFILIITKNYYAFNVEGGLHYFVSEQPATIVAMVLTVYWHLGTREVGIVWLQWWWKFEQRAVTEY